MLRLSAVMASLVLVSALQAQPSQHPLFVAHGVDVDSGVLTNSADENLTVWTEQITVPGATSLQIHFDIARLDNPEDYIEVRNPLDKEVMRLDNLVLKQWRNHSAYFNGDTLEVRLVLTPGSSGRVGIAQVWSGIPRPSIVGPSPDTQCGTVDNRVPSSDVRVCRLMRNATTTGGGCTGWMISNTSTVVSAGHCADPFPDFLVICEFNYPLSTSGGAVQHPGVADQYPVHQDSARWENSGTGNDWAVMRLHPNVNGDTAMDRQGSSFTIAASNPVFVPGIIVPTIRITGNGADFNNNNRNYAQQTSTGPLSSLGSSTLTYRTDSEGGNSGGPVIVESSGQVIGIHTNGGCTSTGGANLGQSIFTSDVASAITAVQGNANRPMVSGSTYTISSTSTIFDYAPNTSRWNAIAVTSTSDWDIESETSAGSNFRVASAAAGNSADVIVANGRLGTPDPISGRIYRFSGTATARASARSATTLTVGTSSTTTISSSTAMRLYEFNVPSGGGTYDVSLFGDTSFRWRLIEPGSNADWRSWSSLNAASGNVGGAVASQLSLSAGWHCIVVTRNGGTVNPSPTDLTVNVCEATISRNLSPTAPITVNAICQDFTVTPVAGRWNGAIISGADSWNVNLGTAHSAITGNSANFALANGNNGAITPTWGSFIRTSGSGSATAHELESSTIGVNTSNARTIGAGLVAGLYQFNITSSGSYDISVSGAAGGFVRLYTPGSNSEWIDRGNSVGGSIPSTGTTYLTQTLSTGWHALVVYRNGGPWTDAQNILVRVCTTASPLMLGLSASGTAVTDACRGYSMTAPYSGRYNVVGITGASAANVINSGNEASDVGGNDMAYLVSNGHAGTTNPTSGTFVRQSGSGTSYLAHGSTTNINLNSTYGAFWSTSTVLRAFEFEITATDDYDISVIVPASTTFTSSDTPWWRLHTPNTAAWERRGESTIGGFSAFSSTQRTINLTPGWYCIVLYSNSGRRSTSGSIQLRVEPTPNPVPVLSGIAPTAIQKDSGNTSMTLNGSSFVPGAIARIDGVNMSTTFNSTTRLTATVPASRLTTSGTRSITVFNPGPGGGTSASRTLTVTNPRPGLTSISPNRATAGSGTISVTMTGGGFNNESVATWNGANLVTTFLSTTTIRATVPAALLTTAGSTASMRVVNPAPGGGTSVAATFTVLYPRPTLSSLSPATRIAGTPSFNLFVNGADFTPASEVLFDSSVMATTYLNSGLVRITVPASRIASVGIKNIQVRNPAPGGGTSSALGLRVYGPNLLSVSPPVVPVQPFGASVNLILDGANFHSGSTVYANSDPLPTTFISSTQLLATVDSITQPMLRVNGNLTLSVSNSPEAFSPFRVLQSGGSNNRGLIVRDPVAPAPGQGYDMVMLDGAAGLPFTMIIDFAPVINTSLYPFIDPTAGYSLNVRPFDAGMGDWFSWLDGIGIYGPPQGFAAFNASGEFRLAGLAVPNPLVGVDLTVQAAFIDPTAAVGYRMTWGRHADRL